ncbi:MAG: preprotein translocase subunit Sec61beta [Candidatus ainarchaeum sp.]|nr:preprotein translocase subunit Sec61beta [Candidatus ainarchaeum sp.]
MVKFIKNKSQNSGPSSAIGITRFFDAESKSPKISPYFVLGASILIIIIMIILKIIMSA